MEARTRALIVLLVALVLIDLSWTAAVDHRSASIERRIEGVEQDQQEIAVFAGASGTTASGTQEHVSLYAYDKGRGEAIAVPARVASVPTDGLYLNVDGVSHTAAVQQSMRTAWETAEASKHPPRYRGAVVDVSPPKSWEIVGGGSAALSLALGFAATNECVELNESVAVTGGLSSDGTVVQVDRVLEKAKNARQRNVTTFLVPAGQGVAVDGIEIVGVSTFREAATYGLNQHPSCIGNTTEQSTIEAPIERRVPT
ncbi:hypothetical protein C440_06607 [Haloferax mucosum ATCC BAA-1512]|uniref:Lon proteolytic domain-containing protein n=2 Tax=Haloferax mucosum TaxID=403181 RepID=M0IGN3_9EURY|nr:hypothetical protein C440_06607 [Haloferax mucosum ATCC BAA-1512]